MKKFSYIDKDSGDKHYGDVAISDVPLLNDKVVNYDSHLSNNNIHVTATNKSDWNTHIADTVKHVTSSDKTSWNGHIANNDIHVTLAKKTSWDNHIADANIHVTTAERAFWNSNSGGLKPFTNCIYVDANFTNSAPYFNNLADAINAATNTTLIIVNGTFNMGSIATTATTINLVSAQIHGSVINLSAVLTSETKNINFYGFKMVSAGGRSLQVKSTFVECDLISDMYFYDKEFFALRSNLSGVSFTNSIVKIRDSGQATIVFQNCQDVELTNIDDLLKMDNLSGIFFDTSSTNILPRLVIKNCSYRSPLTGDVFSIAGTGVSIGFRIRLINSMFCVNGDSSNTYKIINYSPVWTATPILLIDNCVFSGENDNSSRVLISGTGKIYSRNSLVVGSSTSPTEGTLAVGTRTYHERGY